MDKLVHNGITYGIGTIPEEIINEVHRLRAECDRLGREVIKATNTIIKHEQENADLRRALELACGDSCKWGGEEINDACNYYIQQARKERA